MGPEKSTLLQTKMRSGMNLENWWWPSLGQSHNLLLIQSILKDYQQNSPRIKKKTILHFPNYDLSFVAFPSEGLQLKDIWDWQVAATIGHLNKRRINRECKPLRCSQNQCFYLAQLISCVTFCKSIEKDLSRAQEAVWL